jgi:hypothetical protein
MIYFFKTSDFAKSWTFPEITVSNLRKRLTNKNAANDPSRIVNGGVVVVSWDGLPIGCPGMESLPDSWNLQKNPFYLFPNSSTPPHFTIHYSPFTFHHVHPTLFIFALLLKICICSTKELK